MPSFLILPATRLTAHPTQMSLPTGGGPTGSYALPCPRQQAALPGLAPGGHPSIPVPELQQLGTRLAPPLRPICLGRPFSGLSPQMTQLPGSQGHTSPSPC